jgi:uncharacterized protein (DUF1015 family)
MPEIAPFRGILFDPKRVDLTKVLAPVPGAAEASARAAAGWLDAGILVRDPYKAIYRYAQFSAVPGGGRTVVRRGLVAAVRLSTGDARIRPSERTQPELVEASAAALEATRIQAGLAVGLYADAAGEVERVLRQVESRPPVIDVTLGDVRHALWRVTDAEVFGKVRRALVPKRTVLADGHHRYAAAVAVRDRLDAASPLSPQASPQFTPMFLCNGADEGLVVRGSHRLLTGLAGFEARAFLARAREYFVIDAVPGGGKDAAAVQRALDEAPGHQPAIVVAFPGEADAWRLVLDAHVNPQTLGVAAHPMVAKLAPSLLHGLIFERILGLAPAAHEGGGNVRHGHDVAATLVQLATAQAAFLLPALTPDILRNVAELDERLPPRASWLHPALAPGIVMAYLDPDEDLL